MSKPKSHRLSTVVTIFQTTTMTDERLEQLKQLTDDLAHLNMMEATFVTKHLLEKHGITLPLIAGFVPNSYNPPFAASLGFDGMIATEKSLDDLEQWYVDLVSTNGNNLSTVKVLKDFLNIGLKEAKELMETASATIAQNLTRSQADELRERLDVIGATAACRIMW